MICTRRVSADMMFRTKCLHDPHRYKTCIRVSTIDITYEIDAPLDGVEIRPRKNCRDPYTERVRWGLMFRSELSRYGSPTCLIYVNRPKNWSVRETQ